VYISSAVMLYGAQVSAGLYRTFQVTSPIEALTAPPAVESPAKAP
jgi:hypothetical protein